MSEPLFRQLVEHGRRLDELEAQGWPRVQVSPDSVSDPPTDAQLDAAFGTPAVLGLGFVGLVGDINQDENLWLCCTARASWWYVALTQAL